MPRLTVNNTSVWATAIHDTSGYTGFKRDIAASGSLIVDIDSELLERLSPQLDALVSRSIVNYSVADDPTKIDILEALGPARGLAVEEYTKVVDTTDLSAAGLTEAVSLTGFPTDVFVIGSSVELDAVFSGPSVTACTVEIGDTGTPSELVTSQDIFTGASLGLKQAPGALPGTWTLEASYAPEALVTTVDANVDQLDAGSMVIHIWYVTPALLTA